MKPCCRAYLDELDRCDRLWLQEIADWEAGTHPLIALYAEKPDVKVPPSAQPEPSIAILRECIASNAEIRPVVEAARYGEWSLQKWPSTGIKPDQCCPWGGDMERPGPWGWRNYVGVMAAFDADPEGFEASLGPIEVIRP